MINYITGKNNERADVFFRREQDAPGAGDDKLEYKMAQLLKPGMLNFKPQTNEKTELDQSETLNFIEIQPVATAKTRLNFSQFPLKSPKANWKICEPRPKTMTTFTNQWWGRSRKDNERYLRF